MKILIVDDEALARKRVLMLLEETNLSSDIKECANGKEAISTIKEYRPDLIFLDVNLKDMTGFDVLKSIDFEPKPTVIFVTAYDSHAIKAFDFNAFDFLLKPFKDERFFKTIEKVRKLTHTERDLTFEKRFEELMKLHENNNQESRPSNKIPIKQGNKTILLNIQDIIYISASGYYAELITSNKKYLLRESLKNLDDVLDNEQFFRIHRSTIINLDFISEIIHSNYSEIDIKMTEGSLLHVSKSHKKDFLKKLGL
ncbi:LytR/AlgR family response regulator transcription factor [Aegicerativicinus sediminis]|uniref:LytR/AlgR family response regulator transcription factor n=1 Tax=Aegicerativicinus sediminis TaxID=2893202 RepID=UPI001E5842F2|nr:LytTR family DNA-binding domain-containing protein [Aegicerativicinus sediminis]